MIIPVVENYDNVMDKVFYSLSKEKKKLSRVQFLVRGNYEGIYSTLQFCNELLEETNGDLKKYFLSLKTSSKYIYNKIIHDLMNFEGVDHIEVNCDVDQFGTVFAFNLKLILHPFLESKSLRFVLEQYKERIKSFKISANKHARVGNIVKTFVEFQIFFEDTYPYIRIEDFKEVHDLVLKKLEEYVSFELECVNGTNERVNSLVAMPLVRAHKLM
ncbi:hypothetical protein BK742_00010 [Bacillus thuringiensis serovar pingluonsis]|uniref:Uncharacterized protein n=1 Tax=Bacillus thuringiensis serovar pingluonsis TaxID=180881 RepID=A0A243BS73_BACTU|nr:MULTISPECIES: hypothetical protein [Bacillus cereus group]MEB9685189.1 hypothetical protein [Bacillus anthracis]OTY50342.1 hypothetical protein BK742_00010 [Bacillus thuringiensis serovar pingluonsis]